MRIEADRSAAQARGRLPQAPSPGPGVSTKARTIVPSPAARDRARGAVAPRIHARPEASALAPRIGQGHWRSTARLRPGALLEARRAELARVQDHLASADLPVGEKVTLERRMAELATHVGGLSALRGRLVQIVLG